VLKLDKQGAASSTDGSNKAVSSAYTKSVILELPMLIPGHSMYRLYLIHLTNR